MTVQQYIDELDELVEKYRNKAACSSDETDKMVWQEKAFTLALARSKARGIDHQSRDELTYAEKVYLSKILSE